MDMKKKIAIVVFVILCFFETAQAVDIVFSVPKEAYPPIHTVREDGTIYGFSHDLMLAICKEVGITPFFKPAPWDTLFDDIESGKFAASIAASTITEERKKRVNFSDMYFEAEQTVVIRKGSGISKEKDLANKNIGAWGATTNFEACRKVARFNGAKAVVPFPDTESSVRGVVDGLIDAAFMDSPTAASFVFENEAYSDKVEIAFTVPSEVPDLFGFAVNKEEKDLLEKINKGLKAVKDSGEYDRIYEKWFATMAKKSDGSKWNFFKFKFPW